MRTNDLVKTVGEGDWGEEGDLGNPDAQTQPAYTDWLADFAGAGPPIVSSGPEDDDGTHLDQLDSGPQPGPSTRPTYQGPSRRPPTREGDATVRTGGGYKQGGRQVTFSLRTAVKGATLPDGHHLGTQGPKPNPRYQAPDPTNLWNDDRIDSDKVNTYIPETQIQRKKSHCPR